MQPSCYLSKHRVGILKFLRSPEIDSKESVSPAYVAWGAGSRWESILGLLKRITTSGSAFIRFTPSVSTDCSLFLKTPDVVPLFFDPNIGVEGQGCGRGLRDEKREMPRNKFYFWEGGAIVVGIAYEDGAQ
jgi:hypothetical protein